MNLTRFALAFPEKREFFLEGRGLFPFGRGVPGVGETVPVVTPTLFFQPSHRAERRPHHPDRCWSPRDRQGRKDRSRSHEHQTGEESLSQTPSTNFTVVRVKRDILRRSSVGLIFTNRSQSAVGPGASQAYGVDSTFWSFRTSTSAGSMRAQPRPALPLTPTAISDGSNTEGIGTARAPTI